MSYTLQVVENQREIPTSESREQRNKMAEKYSHYLT